MYTGWEPELSVPIASTTKLMSFVIIMDAVRDGEITLDDTVTITEEAVTGGARPLLTYRDQKAIRNKEERASRFRALRGKQASGE